MLEIIVVIGMFTLLIGLSLPSYNLIKDNIAFKNDGNELISNLKIAQLNSVNSMDDVRHGVYFENERYVIFSGEWPAPLSQKIVALKKGVRILSGAGTIVTFDRLTGEAAAAAIDIGTAADNKKTVEINQAGQISLK